MQTLEKFLLGGLVLVGIYLVVNSEQVGGIFQSFASGTSQIFSTLQGR